jgi:type 1 glutamine amidotransferase
MKRRVFLVLMMGAAAFAQPAARKSPQLSRKIVLIGGKKSHGPGEHDFPRAIPLIESLLKGAAPFKGAQIVAFPDGFPADLTLLEGASTLLFYFDGFYDPPPMLEPGRIAEVQKVMDAGAGLICLHQAATVPVDDAKIPFVEWLGAKRNGMFDRTTEPVSLKPETPSHPVCRGMAGFTYEDEFYPTFIFNQDSRHIVPILRARLPKEAPVDHLLAWTFERPNGGRSFCFSGLHYLKAFDQPQIEKMLLNALCWTSGLTVPPQGVAVASSAPR